MSQAGGHPTVSVVVPVLNGLPTFSTLLRGLEQQTFPRASWELIIVDNGSTDGTRELAEDFARRHSWAQVVLAERRGPSAARNVGVESARGSIIAFIDSDCIPGPTWLEELISVFADRTVWAAGGLLKSAAPTTITEAFSARQEILNQEDFFKERPFKPPFLLTANFAVRRAVFKRVGMFNESLRVGEDADFCWRILEAGGKLALVRKALVAHRHRSTLPSFARQMFLYGIGSATTFARHRQLIGRRAWLDFISYRSWLKALVKALLYLLIRRDPYLRREGWLELVRYSCFIAGRLVGSIRNRVVCI
ncbi:MAG: glycosyltransferase [Candidatus Sumerlaeaceae bacterium]|nr:glycosyltransferase [Candidatus Sumerlaeaceae bacterium]